jgi:Spy/CpxP family protein refolding chaperone
MRAVVISLCAVLLILGVAPAGAQSARGGGPPPGTWWTSDKFKQELRLTDDQSARIQQIFQASISQLRSSKDALDREEAGLSKLMASADAQEAEVLLAIDRVETARYTMSKARTVMLFRINRVLTHEQRAKLEEIHRATEPDRGRSSH